MFDAVDWKVIPPDAVIVAGYLNGKQSFWPPAAWKRFPNAVKVPITVTAFANAGDVLDMEWGDATPDQCPGWIRMRQASGLTIPTIYCERSRWNEVKAYCAGLNYDSWIADWTGISHLVPGSAATQWADPATGSGGDFDRSICAPYWPRHG